VYRRASEWKRLAYTFYYFYYEYYNYLLLLLLFPGDLLALLLPPRKNYYIEEGESIGSDRKKVVIYKDPSLAMVSLVVDVDDQPHHQPFHSLSLPLSSFSSLTI